MDFNPEILLQKLSKDAAEVPTDTISAYRINVLLSTILKKYVPPGSSPQLERAAIYDFIERNNGLRKEIVIPEEQEPIFRIWRDTLHSVFCSGPYQTNVLTLDSCLQLAYAGPGSSRGTRHTDFVNKMFNSKLSFTTTALYRHYVANISDRWYQAELLRHDTFGESIYEGSSLSAVPKDATRCRTICTEPSLNMFYQLGARLVIEGLLNRFYGIDTSTQPDINKNMARTSSVHGALCTIDLKNASDDISLALCHYLLPPEVMSVLSLLRSRSTQFNGKSYPLNMISSMGNGFTFPLMTLLFTTLYHALCVYNKTTQINAVNFGCFGDDIIIPSSHYHQFTALLGTAGFTVNSDKSFFTGSFRESCGGDFYNGLDVRGIYLKELNHEPDVYSIFNRLHFWSVKHGIPIRRTLRYIGNLAKYREVPCHAGYHEGFIMPLCSRDPSRIRTDRNGSYYYRAQQPVQIRRRIGDHFANPYGALIGAVGGYVRDNLYTIRPKVVTYKVVQKVTPSWDYLECPDLIVEALAASWHNLLRYAS